jgi:hypothetical protein
MALERSPIFAGEAFADYANRAKLTIQTEVKNQSERHNRSTWMPVKDRGKLLAEQAVTTRIH